MSSMKNKKEWIECLVLTFGTLTLSADSSSSPGPTLPDSRMAVTPNRTSKNPTVHLKL